MCAKCLRALGLQPVLQVWDAVPVVPDSRDHAAAHRRSPSPADRRAGQHPPVARCTGHLMGRSAPLARRGRESRQRASSTRCGRHQWYGVRGRSRTASSLVQRALLSSCVVWAAASPLSGTVPTAPLAVGEPFGSPMGAGSARRLQEAGSVSQARFISAGGQHSCGVSTGGAGYCWGSTTDGRSSVPSGVTWAAISAGGWHSCGVSTGGRATVGGGTISARAACRRASPGPPSPRAIITRAA